MKQLGTKKNIAAMTPNVLASIKNYYNIIIERSNLAFFDFNLESSPADAPNTKISDMQRFSVTAERLLKQNFFHHAYTMVVFDIDCFKKMNECLGYSHGDELLRYIEKTLQTYISAPNLFCRVHDDNFALFLEDYKEIDIALLVIQLTEEISKFASHVDINLSFGICKAEFAELDIPSLCSRAFYAKSTIKGKEQQLLADYDEVIQTKEPIFQ